ncbi:PIN domain-containing protein [Candidatus Pacearchaeota archaeon]|nr:PIN domain-containing protein [Candidatus Pacearchaeota archaeon]
MKYVIDSHAWINYFEGNPAGEKIKEIIENQSNEIITNILCLSELSSFMTKKGFDAEKPYNAIIALSKIYTFDAEFSKEVGILHANIRKKIKDFGLVDAFVLLTSRKINAKILTGDPHFKGFSNVLLIK